MAVEVNIACDVCGRVWDGGSSAAEVRARLREQGWTRRGRQDFCPQHASGRDGAGRLVLRRDASMWARPSAIAFAYHWPRDDNPTVSACGGAALLDDGADPHDVPSDQWCGRPGCRRRWEQHHLERLEREL